MVSIIENWSRLEGQITAIAPSRELPRFAVVQVTVARVTAVESFPNLLADAAGQTLDIFVASELAERLQLAPGQWVRCWVRRGGPTRIFAHPEEFAVR